MKREGKHRTEERYKVRKRGAEQQLSGENIRRG